MVFNVPSAWLNFGQVSPWLGALSSFFLRAFPLQVTFNFYCLSFSTPSLNLLSVLKPRNVFLKDLGDIPWNIIKEDNVSESPSLWEDGYLTSICTTVSQLVQSLSRVRLFVTPMNHSTPGLPVHHQLLEFTQIHVHWVGDAIQPSHPLLSPSPPTPNFSKH